MRTRVTELFGTEYPIFAFSHCRDVVAAVSRAGGMVTFPVGQIVGSMNRVKPAGKVVLELIEEYIEAIDRLNTITEG